MARSKRKRAARDYTLDQKIEALNLLDLHDDDCFIVKQKLGIPVTTLRGWRADETAFRRRYDERQYRHFANLRHELLKDMLETARGIMKRIKRGEHEGEPDSKSVYTLDTLLRNAKDLEERYVHLASDAGGSGPEVNRIRYVHDHHLQAAAPRPAGDPEASRALQGAGLRPALGQIGAGQAGDPEGGAS